MPRILTPNDVTDFRNRVCDTAMELLAEFGDDGFNMRALARRLGVSAMTAYRYFTDKNEILSAVRARGFARLADKLEAAADKTFSTEPKLLVMARAYLEFAREEQVYYRYMFNLAQPRRAEPQELRWEERRARDAFVDPACEQANGECAGENSQAIGLILWSSLHGIATLNLTRNLSDADCDALITGTIHALVRCSGSALEFRSAEHRAKVSLNSEHTLFAEIDHARPS